MGKKTRVEKGKNQKIVLHLPMIFSRQKKTRTGKLCMHTANCFSLKFPSNTIAVMSMSLRSYLQREAAYVGLYLYLEELYVGLLLNIAHQFMEQ